MSYLGCPSTVEEMIDSMRKAPADVDHFTVRYNDDLLIGLRNSDGSLSAFRASIRTEAHHREPIP